VSEKGDGDTMVQEILYGQGQSKRGSRCFIFILEDKTRPERDEDEEEEGGDTGRLYGICVVHPRLLHASSAVSDGRRDGVSEGHEQWGEGSTERESISLSSSSSSLLSTVGNSLSTTSDFESSVCYCFITRFPLFDFFFQVVFDMIAAERLTRMEAIAELSVSRMPGTGGGAGVDYFTFSRKMYDYLPHALFQDTLERLTLVPPPRYGETIAFQVNPSIQPSMDKRALPASNTTHD
jgi:hypothetical protein